MSMNSSGFEVLDPLPRRNLPKEKMLLPKGMVPKGAWEAKQLANKFKKKDK